MRIVLGVDGSDPSLIAQRLLLHAGWPRPLEVTVVSAFEPRVDWSGTMAPGFLPADDDVLRSEASAILDELAEPLRRAGWAVELVARAGRAATVLADVARERAADLIVVGNRGRGPARAALLGSVSAALVDHAPCPVLVARRPRVRRMLVATDGSEASAHAADILVGWRVFPDARVDVLHVAPRATHLVEGLVTPWSVSGDLHGSPPDSHTGRQHGLIAEEMASRLSHAGWRSQPFVRNGDPAHEITDAATELDADLIVTGSRGLGDIHRILAGSVAHDVLLHSGASVLVMRGHVHATARERATAPVAFAS